MTSPKEYRTTIQTPSDKLLHRTEQTWEQRQPVSWWNTTTNPNYTDSNGAPPNDPRITVVNLVTADPLTSKGKLRRRTIDYGVAANRYNNEIDVAETGYGAEDAATSALSPGTNLRRIHNEFETGSSYVATALISSPNATDIFKTNLPKLKKLEYLCGPGTGACTDAAAVSKTELLYDQLSVSAIPTTIVGHDTSISATIPFYLVNPDYRVGSQRETSRLRGVGSTRPASGLKLPKNTMRPVMRRRSRILGASQQASRFQTTLTLPTWQEQALSRGPFLRL